MAKKIRPEKESKVLEKVRTAVKAGRYRDTRHATQRGIERNILLPDIIEVLMTGYHEKKKDEYKEDFQSWNYAIRGVTSDGEHLRVAIYFDENLVVIVTVIKLLR